MRIAYFLPAFPLVSETFILRQITGMLDRGHAVDVFARVRGPAGPVHAEIERYDLFARTEIAEAVPRPFGRRVAGALALARRHRAWRRPGVVLRALDPVRHGRQAASLSLLYGALPLLGKPRYDVLHCQFGTEGERVLPLRTIGALAGKLVTSIRGFDAPGPGRDYRRLFRDGDLFLPVSRSLAERLLAAGCPREKVEVLHSGIDLGRLPCAPPRRAPGEPLRLVSVARLVEKKGLDDALRAVAALRAAGRDVRYSVCGTGPLREELERLAAELGVSDVVRWLGALPHAAAIAVCREAHVLVAPSVTARDGDVEGIPNALKEAMALGLPVVATRHGGIPELVDDGVSGLLVPERDPAALAAGLASLLEHPERWDAMGRAGCAKVEAEFDAERLNDRLVELYRR